MEVSLAWIEGGKSRNIHLDSCVPALRTGDGAAIGGYDYNLIYTYCKKRAISKGLGDPDNRDPGTKLCFYITDMP